MRINQFFKLLTALILLLNTGCIDTIEVDLPSDGSQRLVIDGVVERSPDIYRFFVRISTTSELGEELIASEVRADIQLVLNGIPVRSLTNAIADTISIEEFHQLYGGSPEEATFNIGVTLPDGSEYESVTQKVLENPVGSDIKLNYVTRQELNDVDNIVERGYVKVQISTPVINARQERVSLRWDVYGVYRFPEVAWTEDPFFFPKTCYVRDFLPVNKVKVLKSTSVRTDFVDGFEVAELDADHRFASGYYFTVIQKSISDDAAIYWDQVRQSISRGGTIFDSPVGAVKSNISQIGGDSREALGYFYTAGIDTLRHLSTRDETGGQLHLCAFQTVSEACCDCLILVNSTLDKPSYWK